MKDLIPRPENGWRCDQCSLAGHAWEVCAEKIRELVPQDQFAADESI